MRIEIATLPKAVQEWVATLPFDDDIHLAKSSNELMIDEPLFDIDQMKKAIAGCETEELALKNGIAVPDWALADFDSFQKWRNQRISSKAMQ